MKKTFHYKLWREDFELVRQSELKYLRYGPPYYRAHLAPGKYDWEFADETLAELHRLGINVIADLCHFGVPDWIGNFQNEDWPKLFAEYAGAFAKRYPWINLYTPVNEIFVCARFSAQLGIWNERLQSNRGFVTALKNLVMANHLAEDAILKANPKALFIQSESTEYFHPESPGAVGRATQLNEERFLSLDLCYGVDVKADMLHFLMDNGLSWDEYQNIRGHGIRLKPHCIMGNDYYFSNEHDVPEGDKPVRPAGDLYGYYIITKQYYDRYRMPVMHTETNHRDTGHDARNWLRRQWVNLLLLKHDGVPIIGFTWYSLIDQVDWDSALTQNNGNVDPLGLYDMDRRIRPVGEKYRELVRVWRNILPLESQGLTLHQAQNE